MGFEVEPGNTGDFFHKPRVSPVKRPSQIAGRRYFSWTFSGSECFCDFASFIFLARSGTKTKVCLTLESHIQEGEALKTLNWLTSNPASNFLDQRLKVGTS